MIRLLSYNIRYNNPADGENAWPYRKAKVSGLLQLYQPDLIGLQEVLHDQLTDVAHALPNFGWLGVGRDDGQKRGEYAPIFYRRARFDVADSGTFWLSETPQVAGSFGWDAVCVRIATWAILVDKLTQTEWLHLNTHFDHKGQLAQLNSVRLLAQFLTGRRDIGRILVTGDFNCVSGSPPYQRLIEPDNTDHISLADAMHQSQSPHHGPSGTLNSNFIGPIRDKIDFIFVWPTGSGSEDGTVQVHRHAVLADHWDGCYPSDHLPVLADIE